MKKKLENIEKVRKSGYTVRGVKTFRGMEGVGFNATLYLNGKKLGLVMDDANGGTYHYEITRAAEEELRKFGDTLTEPWGFETNDTSEYHYGADGVLNVLVDDYLENQRLKRLCKTKTVFMVKNSGDLETYSINAKFTPQVVLGLRKRHGKNLVEFVNERFI